MINYDTVTVEDCLDNYRQRSRTVILDNGKITEIKEGKQEQNPTNRDSPCGISCYQGG